MHVFLYFFNCWCRRELMVCFLHILKKSFDFGSSIIDSPMKISNWIDVPLSSHVELLVNILIYFSPSKKRMNSFRAWIHLIMRRPIKWNFISLTKWWLNISISLSKGTMDPIIELPRKFNEKAFFDTLRWVLAKVVNH